MSRYLGYRAAGSVVYVYFDTFGTNGESLTMSGLAVTDIEIFKNGTITTRASDAGYTLLETDGIDLAGYTGIHGFSIDLSNNSDAGFFAAGSFYTVIVNSITINGQTVSFVAASFDIGGVADILTTAMTESYAADGAAPTLAQALFAIQQFLQERAVSGTTLTVKKLDGSATAATFTLDSATAPTSITRAS